MSATARLVGPDEAVGLRERLAEILVDGVAGGASIGFLDGFSVADAAAWWDGVLADHRAGRLVLIGGWVGPDLVGTVQLGLSSMPNGRFRGDVRKLVVHRNARRHGVASALMRALDAEARGRGLRTLVLDTATGSPAEGFYAGLGWTRVGVIPDYALWPDGAPCATTLFWKAV